MYLRHTTRRRNGKAHTYWTLVRSVRQGSKVRQETVAQLGKLDAAGRSKASKLARYFLGPQADEPGLFEDTRELTATQVRVGKVRVERGRAFGSVWLAWTLWQALRLDRFCDKHLPKGREEVAWAQVAAILVIARLCEPSSELHIAEDWYRRTALEDLLGVAAAKVYHTRLYQGLDQLLEHKVELETHIKERLGGLFALEYDLLLYDVTSTYFEGEAKANPMAKFGYSRDNRGDCKQVCIGLVVTREGFPLGYEVFDGNRVDVTTVEGIVEKIEVQYGKAGRVWVMDRGMCSEENLEWLRQGERRYLIGTPRSEMKKWAKELEVAEGWQQVRDELEVKICAGPDGEEVFLLCRSADRQRKEEAMHERFTKRIRDQLGSLGRRLKRARKPVSKGGVERQIGRILERNSRAGKKFEVWVLVDPRRRSGLTLKWIERRDWKQWATLTEGTYILRSNVADWTADELWRTYVQLYQAEAAFRINKSDLSIRPIWHQTPERVQAHILVCFLAFCLWKTLEGWQQRAGLGNSPRTILEELGRIQCVDVVLPVVDGPELRLRCVVEPDKAQAALIERLGLRLPRRLRVPAEVEM
ncbi:MAG TPA: IS1634 family transposase [Gammaproteobacteria bacterium]